MNSTFAGSNLGLALERLARRRCPILVLLIALGVAVIGALEIAKGNDKTGPAVDEAAFENIVFQERPQPVADCARHGDALAGKLWRAERRVPVRLVDDFSQVAERELPYRIRKRSDRLVAEEFKTFVHRL